MLQRMWECVVLLWHRRDEQERAYQRFLEILAQSPTEWTMLESGAIRSSQGECPIMEVYQRTIKHGRADTVISCHVLWVADQLGLWHRRALLIIGAADVRKGNTEQIRVRNDLLTALAKARERMDATKEGILAAECRWENPEKETVRV